MIYELKIIVYSSARSAFHTTLSAFVLRFDRCDMVHTGGRLYRTVLALRSVIYNQLSGHLLNGLAIFKDQTELVCAIR